MSSHKAPSSTREALRAAQEEYSRVARNPDASGSDILDATAALDEAQLDARAEGLL